MSALQNIPLPYIVVGIAVALLIFVALRMQPPKVAERLKPRGPGKARYVCTRCSGEFLHSNRTISAWEKGTRKIFCDGCHKQWRNSQPRTSGQQPSQSSAGTHLRHSSPQGKGCLGLLVVMVLVPAAVVYVGLLA